MTNNNTKNTREEKWKKYKNPLLYIILLLCLALFYLLDMSQLDISFNKQLKLKTSTTTKTIFSITTTERTIFDKYYYYGSSTSKLKNSGTITNNLTVKDLLSLKTKALRKSKFLIENPGCQIPYLEPYDKSVLKYIYRVKKFICSRIPPLVESNLTSLYIAENAISFYNITKRDLLRCFYRPFWRQDPEEDTNLPDNMYKFGEYHLFNSSVDITEEYVEVNCKYQDVDVYKDFHAFVPDNTFNSNNNNNNNNNNRDNKLSILMIGMDSISRLNFQRQMPLTYKYLKRKLKAVELLGYNKVGDNTFPNLIPILTGLSEKELEEKCWKSKEAKFDSCPFIWKNFSAAGYKTAYAEDASWMGIFNYWKSGFQQQPTDYYYKTFNYLAESEIGHTRSPNAYLCLGVRPVYATFLDYILKFVITLKETAFFSFFWGTSLSHDHLNYPALGDETYEMFFKILNSMGVLNKTALIFISDHGMRWGEIRSTYQGQIEERLPFVFFVFPKWFSKQYPTAIKNLRQNTMKLTTPFDLYETILDILRLKQAETNKKHGEEKHRRGISLFSAISDNRTCADAGIAPHWCTCQVKYEVNKNSSAVGIASIFVIDYINQMVANNEQCHELTLDKILDARLLQMDDFQRNNSIVHDYTLIVQTKPGNGLFEATVRCTFCNGTDFNITGSVSRINLYGNQSYCVTDFRLKLYCYCGVM